jgi:hypothetical protein
MPYRFWGLLDSCLAAREAKFYYKERARFNLSMFTFEKLGTKGASVSSCSTYFMHVPKLINRMEERT